MPPRHGYSSALRAIGQALETQDIDAFDLQCDNDEFRLQCGDPTPPYLSLIELRYSLKDIECLELEGRAKRGDAFKTVDFDGLPQILRALGGYLDNTGARLLRICNSDASATNASIKVEYTSPDGQLKAEELSIASIYQQGVRMVQERTRSSGDTQGR
jgi:hypothetical protein